MAWLGDREFWVNLIGYASIVSAAIFGLLALFTDYKKEGKITRWGRLYAGGIALSAVFAMTSSVLQKRIAADEAAAGAESARNQQERQQTQFDTQLGHLQRLNGQMARVNQNSSTILDRMAASLRAQTRLLASAQQGMLLTSRLGVQERENTGRVLRGLWDESTRVTNSSITASVSTTCDPIQPGRDFPRLFSEGTVGMLRVARGTAVERLRPYNRFRGLESELPQDALTFVDLRPLVIVRRLRSADWEGVSELVSLTSFTTEGPIMERPEDWEGAAVELIVTADRPGIVAAVNEAMAGQVSGGLEALERWFIVPRETREDNTLSVAVLPCQLQMEISVNGRLIARRVGNLIYGRDRRTPQDILIAKFPIVETERNIFPGFTGR